MSRLSGMRSGTRSKCSATCLCSFSPATGTGLSTLACRTGSPRRSATPSWSRSTKPGISSYSSGPTRSTRPSRTSPTRLWRRARAITTMAERASAGLSTPPAVTARLIVPGAAQMRLLGARLARLLRRGDLVVLAGSLGAGKPTLVQGIGAGLGVRGPVTSPTFVIARVHPAAAGSGPALVHADAYRLGSIGAVDDLDLDTDAGRAVTVVEWGTGLAEPLAADRLEITIEPDRDGDARTVRINGHGARWNGALTGAVDRL